MRSEKNLFQGLVRGLHKQLFFAHQTCLKRPKLTLVAFFAFLGLCLAPLPSLKMMLSIDDLIDPDFQTYSELKELKDRFLDQDELFVLIRPNPPRPLNKLEICSIQKWIFNTTEFRGDLRAIVSTLGIQWPKESAHKFQVLPILAPDCLKPEETEEQHLRAAVKQLLDSPWKGTLIGNDGNDIAMLIYPYARNEGSFFGTFDHKIVDELKESFRKEVIEKHPGLTDEWIGDGIFQYFLKKGYERMPILNSLISVFIIIFFFFFLGSFKSSVIFLQAVTWVSLPIYAGMALLNHPIDVLSSSLSLMVFVASLEDFIFLSKLSEVYGWKRAYRKLLLPSFFTSLTTVVGFGSLVLADLEIIRRFGFWGAVAAGVEWLVFFLVLPAIFVLFPKLQNWSDSQRSQKIMNKVAPLFQSRPHRFVTYLLLLIFPLGIYSTQSLYVSDSPERLMRPSHPTRLSLNKIEETRGWRAQVSLVFEDHYEEGFNRRVLKEVSTWPLVSNFESPFAIADYLTQDLSPPMKNYFKGLLSQDILAHRLGPDGLMSRAIIYVKNLDIVDINQMRRQVSKLCPNKECWLAGSLVSYGELGERVLNTLYKSLGGSLILVSLLIGFLSLAMGKKNFFPLVLSAMWGPLALLVIFYLFNIPVYYITSMVASILVGLAGDNAIQFLFFSNDKSFNFDRGLKVLSPMSLTITMATCLAASVFFFGYFDPMKSLGAMLITGLILSLFGDIWVLRGLTQTNTSRH